MKNRLVSLLLALLMALSLLPTALAESTVDESEHITIRVITQSHPLTINLNDMPVWQELQKKHNLTIEWDQVAIGGWNEKKAVVLSNPDDMPDLWLSGLGDGDLTMNQGAFLDMTDLINQYAPHIQQMFEEEPDTLGLAKSSDGAIYSLPQVRPFRPNSFAVMMINKTWLDKLGLDMPTNLDELEQVLIAFRDGDPNGNGIQDEIPLDWDAGRGSAFPITALCGAWGTVEDESSTMVTVKDGKVNFLWETEAYKNLQSYLHRLWTENLINTEVYTQGYSGMMAKSRQGEYPMVGVTLGWSIMDRMGQYSDEYVVLDALKASADSEIHPLWPANPVRVVMDSNKASISANTKYPERIMALLDDIYSEYYSIQMYYGSIPNQVTYDEATDTYIILDPPEGEYLDNVKWTNSLVDYAPLYFSKALTAKTTAPAEETARIDQDNVYADNFPTEIYPLVKFDMETTEELAFLSTDIYKIVDEKMATWVVDGGVEEEWDAYLAQLEGMGLSEMCDYYQKAYDAYYGK